MAGRGEAKKAPAVKTDMGYEFRAITSPNTLYHITEPFGKDENDINGVKDEFHYYQEGYNIVGNEAGKNAGKFVIKNSPNRNCVGCSKRL